VVRPGVEEEEEEDFEVTFDSKVKDDDCDGTQLLVGAIDYC